jgi:hypothetical protein
VEPIASTSAAPAPKSRRIFIVTSPKVLRSTDAESRQRIVMVHSAPITPHRKFVRSSARFINEGTDASIINLTPSATCAVSDLKASRNDIRKPLISTL